MPRHSPNALTSHLRVHTTNDNPDIPAVGMAFSVAHDADDCFLSQPNITCVDLIDNPQTVACLLFINRTSAASIEKPIHNVKVPMNEAEASLKTRSKAGTVVFISGKTPLATSHRKRQEMVEPIGIEPMTPCLQSRCSPS